MLNSQLRPGWLAHQFRLVNIETATWSPAMRKQANIDTRTLSPSERAEAVRRLRQWADELEAEGM